MSGLPSFLPKGLRQALKATKVEDEGTPEAQRNMGGDVKPDFKVTPAKKVREADVPADKEVGKTVKKQSEDKASAAAAKEGVKTDARGVSPAAAGAKRPSGKQTVNAPTEMPKQDAVSTTAGAAPTSVTGFRRLNGKQTISQMMTPAEEQADTSQPAPTKQMVRARLMEARALAEERLKALAKSSSKASKNDATKESAPAATTEAPQQEPEAPQQEPEAAPGPDKEELRAMLAKARALAEERLKVLSAKKSQRVSDGAASKESAEGATGSTAPAPKSKAVRKRPAKVCEAVATADASQQDDKEMSAEKPADVVDEAAGDENTKIEEIKTDATCATETAAPAKRKYTKKVAKAPKEATVEEAPQPEAPQPKESAKKDASATASKAPASKRSFKAVAKRAAKATEAFNITAEQKAIEELKQQVTALQQMLAQQAEVQQAQQVELKQAGNKLLAVEEEKLKDSMIGTWYYNEGANKYEVSRDDKGDLCFKEGGCVSGMLVVEDGCLVASLTGAEPDKMPVGTIRFKHLENGQVVFNVKAPKKRCQWQADVITTKVAPPSVSIEQDEPKAKARATRGKRDNKGDLVAEETPVTADDKPEESPQEDEVKAKKPRATRKKKDDEADVVVEEQAATMVDKPDETAQEKPVDEVKAKAKAKATRRKKGEAADTVTEETAVITGDKPDETMDENTVDEMKTKKPRAPRRKKDDAAEADTEEKAETTDEAKSEAIEETTPQKKAVEEGNSKADGEAGAAQDDELDKSEKKVKAKAKAPRRKRDDGEDLVTEEMAAAMVDNFEEAPQKKAKKVKVEAPYVKFKDAGSIPEPTIARKEVPAGTKSLKAMAWNVSGLKFWKMMVPELIRREQPDVLGIIEHKLGFPSAYSVPGYETAALLPGALILVRKEGPQAVSVIPCDLPSAQDEGRLIIAEFEEVFVVLANAPNSGDNLERLAERTGQWDVQLREKLDELNSKKPTLLVGDLNVAHREEDIWNSEMPSTVKKSGTTAEERESFSSLLSQGFMDGFVQTHASELGAFTYWSNEGNRSKNRGLRLDYAIASRSLQGIWGPPALLDVFHLTEMATGGDHCPVGAVLSL